MNSKLVKSLINIFPTQQQDIMMKCIFIVGFDKLIKKGFILNRIPKISEITDYANKIQSRGRLQEEPNDIKHELDQLKDEISKLTQQIQYNNSIIQRQTQRSHERLVPMLSPFVDERKRSMSVGVKGQKKPREITPKITETIPQTINQIHINIQKHHLDDTEIKSVMRDTQNKPPKPKEYAFKKVQQQERIETEEAPIFEDTDRYLVKEHCIPQILQYSQLQHSQHEQQQHRESQHLQQSQTSQQSQAKGSDQQSHNTHNTNQTFAQPQSSQKHLLQQSRQIKSPNRSPKFKYQSKNASKKNLETVQEEQSHVKHTSTHSASSKGRGSHQQSKHVQSNFHAVSKIKALLDQDKKIYKQHLQDVASERGSFMNSSEKFKNTQDEHKSELVSVEKKRAFSNSSFYKQQPIVSNQFDYEPKLTNQTQMQFQGSQSMTNSNRLGGTPPLQDKILIYSKYKQQMEQYSPKLKHQYRPQSVGKDSEMKRSEDFNRSSVSSTFSMFNPNEELKTFFQNDFLERKRYIPQSDFTKQSSMSSDQNQHQSKYITTSQIEDQQAHIIQYSPYVDKSNVFNNNRLSVTRILNNSQI